MTFWLSDEDRETSLKTRSGLRYLKRMRVRLPSELLLFDLPEGWWIEAGMADLIPAGQSYPFETADCLLPIAHVAPIYHLFLANKRSASLERQRLLRIVTAIRTEHSVPPISVAPLRAPMREGFRYCLIDGLHRLVASAAFGFTHVPVVHGGVGPATAAALERVLERPSVG